jgi:hypothetical protein
MITNKAGVLSSSFLTDVVTPDQEIAQMAALSNNDFVGADVLTSTATRITAAIARIDAEDANRFAKILNLVDIQHRFANARPGVTAQIAITVLDASITALYAEFPAVVSTYINTVVTVDSGETVAAIPQIDRSTFQTLMRLNAKNAASFPQQIAALQTEKIANFNKRTRANRIAGCQYATLIPKGQMRFEEND